jgi:putative transposase
MKYEFIVAHESEYGVQQMCRVLGVCRSGYYAWRKRPASRHTQANERLLVQIRMEYRRSQQTYGSPRIYKHLRDQGVVCSRKRVAHMMRLVQLVAKKGHRRRHPRTTQRDPHAQPAPNLLHQEFAALAPNRKWASDITYIDTAQGWLYLAVVIDLFSRRVVGWAMQPHIDAALVQQAWQMALTQRQPATGLLHHSDQGSQYTSAAYQHDLAAAHCQISMSRVGNCFDNAVVESFFATLKAECADHPFATHAQARTAIFEYIEGWYNRQRLHSTLGYLSPLAFEQKSRQ